MMPQARIIAGEGIGEGMLGATVDHRLAIGAGFADFLLESRDVVHRYERIFCPGAYEQLRPDVARCRRFRGPQQTVKTHDRSACRAGTRPFENGHAAATVTD